MMKISKMPIRPRYPLLHSEHPVDREQHPRNLPEAERFVTLADGLQSVDDLFEPLSHLGGLVVARTERAALAVQLLQSGDDRTKLTLGRSRRRFQNGLLDVNGNASLSHAAVG